MNSKFPYIAGLAAALIISICAGYFFSSPSDDYSAAPVQSSQKIESPPKVESPSTVESPIAQSAATIQSSSKVESPPKIESPPKVESSSTAQSPQKITPIPRQTGALNAADLSLGNFSIDDSEEKVRQALGEPLKTTVENGLTRLKYDRLEVVLRNGKISALVSQTSAVSTPRGIHDGSTDREVFDAYGTNYQSSHFENTTLYEYTITSREGTPCWLRFAVRDGDSRVDYISVRFVQ